jgi:hypothetical protein
MYKKTNRDDIKQIAMLATKTVHAEKQITNSITIQIVLFH